MKVTLFMEGLGSWDCRSCLCPGRHGTSHLSHRWGLYLPMEDQYFSVNGERLAPTEGSSACRGLCGRWVSSWQHHLVFQCSVLLYG